jgi:hypothetical protein
MAAVFRSWEERFGAVLVGLSFDVLTFAVGRPARNLAEATGIAAEHTAICPDNVWQGGRHTAGIRPDARSGQGVDILVGLTPHRKCPPTC